MSTCTVGALPSCRIDRASTPTAFTICRCVIGLRVSNLLVAEVYSDVYAVLSRMMSLHDGCKHGLVDSGGIAILLPLLASKVDHVRWCVRQVAATHSKIGCAIRRIDEWACNALGCFAYTRHNIF